MDEVERAKQIIAQNMYLTIASATPDGQPWITPVYMCFDGQYNFYWASKTDTRHSQIIAENNKVAIIIFDSTAPEGSGKGVYIDAKVDKVIDAEEIKKIIPLYYDRKNKPHKGTEEFNEDSKRRFYKATPQKVWINEDGVDKRVEINLN